MKLLFILFFLSNILSAKTIFVDPLANIVHYDISQERQVGQFSKSDYNFTFVEKISHEKNIYIFNEFSGLGKLDLENMPHAMYIKPPENHLEILFLFFNELGFIKNDDFFLTLDKMLFYSITWHPIAKKRAIENILKDINPKEQIFVYTTTWKSGEALYKAALKNHKNVKYYVRDLSLKKTLFPREEKYPLILSEENTEYFIFDNNLCIESFNLRKQAQFISSEHTFLKQNKFRESNQAEEKLVNQIVDDYIKINCLH